MLQSKPKGRKDKCNLIEIVIQKGNFFDHSKSGYSNDAILHHVVAMLID